MTTEVIITGTGYPLPDPHRAGPGVLVRYGDITLQFDTGRATAQRLAAAGVWLPDLTAVFVTHHHSDHLTGFPDVVLSHWVIGRGDHVKALPVVVPAGPAEDYVREMLHPWRHDLAVRAEHAKRTKTAEVDVIAFEAADSPTEVWRRGDVVVSAAQVRHEPVFPAVGYRVSTPDGEVAISGDTLVCDEVAVLADGVDVLVHEAMLFPVIEQGPPARHFILDYHADTRLLGAQAAQLGLPTLVLTHLIPAPGAEATEQDYEDAIRTAGYTGDLLVANDLDTVVLEPDAAPRIDRHAQRDGGGV